MKFSSAPIFGYHMIFYVHGLWFKNSDFGVKYLNEPVTVHFTERF